MNVNNKKLVKYFLIWSFMCIVNAGYAFVVAESMGYNIIAMLIVVFAYIVFFSFLSLTVFYTKLRANKMLYRSVFIGYLINAVIFYAHDFLGILSYEVIKYCWGGGKLFLVTFFMTFLMGLFLNIMGIVIITVVYFIQKTFVYLLGHKN